MIDPRRDPRQGEGDVGDRDAPGDDQDPRPRRDASSRIRPARARRVDRGLHLERADAPSARGPDLFEGAHRGPTALTGYVECHDGFADDDGRNNLLLPVPFPDGDASVVRTKLLTFRNMLDGYGADPRTKGYFSGCRLSVNAHASAATLVRALAEEMHRCRMSKSISLSLEYSPLLRNSLISHYLLSLMSNFVLRHFNYSYRAALQSRKLQRIPILCCSFLVRFGAEQ